LLDSLLQETKNDLDGNEYGIARKFS